ncbi:unnamed protein product, partial [Mesorhabditis spiculigera]
MKIKAKAPSQIHENTGIEVDPINFQVEQTEDTMVNSSQSEEVSRIIDTLVEKEAKMTEKEMEAMKRTGNDIVGMEKQMTTPDFLDVDPFAVEATTSFPPIILSPLDEQLVRVIPTESTESTSVPTTEAPTTTTKTPSSAELRVRQVANLRRGDAFVYNVSNTLNFAAQQVSGFEQKPGDTAALILEQAPSNSTVIPETNTTIYDNGTVVGQLETGATVASNLSESSTESSTAAGGVDSSTSSIVNKELIDPRLSALGIPGGTVLNVPLRASVEVFNPNPNPGQVRTLFNDGGLELDSAPVREQQETQMMPLLTHPTLAPQLQI